MSNNTDISKLDDLIVTTIDSVKGYDHSADHANAARYAGMFRELATERRDVVLTLQTQSRALGGGDEVIVKEIERGEDYLKEEYERALRDTAISAETRAIMDRCYATVKRGHDEVSRLKHQFADAN